MWLKYFMVLLLVIPIVLGNLASKVINGNGYPLEIHTITTKDGYILKTYRIPCGPKCVKPNKPALITHGLFGNSEQFLMLGNNSLPLLLAGQGYDVWMINFRGTDPSRRHKSLTGQKYWNFSWHEIAIYDVADNIDYILEYTQSSELFYVGHSLGCTVLMVLTSEKLECNKKISLAQCMAPGVLLYHFKDGFSFALAQISDFLWELANLLRLYAFPLPNGPIKDLARAICLLNDDFHKACLIMLSSIGGDVLHYHITLNLDDLLSFFPQAISLKQIAHYAQVIRDGAFQKFNYGSERNLQIYGNRRPPPYNLSRVVVPVVLYTSKGDRTVSDEGVRALSKILPNVIAFNEVELEKFNHNDYMVAPEAKEFVFDKILWYFLQIMK